MTQVKFFDYAELEGNNSTLSRFFFNGTMNSYKIKAYLKSFNTIDHPIEFLIQHGVVSSLQAIETEYQPITGKLLTPGQHTEIELLVPPYSGIIIKGGKLTYTIFGIENPTA
ncbi:hypothetical protein D3C72_185130 [compost metagenome]